MRTAKISELKAKLSAHIQFVKNGEEVLILDRNTPVARLVAPGVVAEEDAQNRAGFIPVPAGDHPISQEVMDQIWEEERADRC